MNIKSRYKMRIDELNDMVLTAFGYRFGDFDKQLKTPDFWDEFDETHEYPYDDFDELKTTPKKESEEVVTVTLTVDEKKKLKEDILEYLIFAYTDGIDAVNEMLTSDVEVDTEGLFLSINKVTAGETCSQRLDRHISEGDVPGIVRTVETEFHRIFNDGIEDGGKRAGAIHKKWQTMKDDKVRDAHWVLQGVTIPFDEKFYVDGDEADKPGGFKSASLNVNCRCYLELSN